MDAPRIGTLAAGPLDSLADVAGVTVGHCTLDAGAVQTGVTAILPHGGDLFMHKVPAGLAVLNGFGKSMGLVQVQELGVLETSIALTNTLSVGTVATALTREAIARQPEIGRSLPTVNPLVFECNDGYLNDAQAFAVHETHLQQALAAAGSAFAQGSVGAGRGMSAFGVKGGIGSASRIAVGGHTVGALVLANFGRPEQLIVAGKHLGPQLLQRLAQAESSPERGSIIIILATDVPLDSRQLTRLARRAGAGLARTGSDYGHGSGDIALAFSTAYTVPQNPREAMPALAMLHEAMLDSLFQAAAQATEQAIVNALFAATEVVGRDGHQRLALRDLL
nr:P1 family peptidase [uncultured Roseateles sp.]